MERAQFLTKDLARKAESLGWLAPAREAKGLPVEARKTLAAAKECASDNPFLEEVAEFLDYPDEQFLPRN